MAMIEQESEFVETVVHINRVAKVVKGGKNFSFSAVVVAGDGHGQVGYGAGKAREVPAAIQKAMEQAKRSMRRVPMVGGTIPHEIWGRWGATRVLLRPASPGTGVIAGGGVRAVMESAGVQDVLTKIIGSRNPFNVVRACFDAIENMLTDSHVRRLRGIDEDPEEAAAAEAPSAAEPQTEPAAAEGADADEPPSEAAADAQRGAS
jgi:small subunit ribosomal protein S5